MAQAKKAVQSQSYKSVWDALTDTPEEAENMKVRAELIHQIVEHVKRRNMTHQEAAELCQVTRPRMTDLLNGKISKFSLDALVKIVANAGFSIHVRLEERVHEEEFA